MGRADRRRTITATTAREPDGGERRLGRRRRSTRPTGSASRTSARRRRATSRTCERLAVYDRATKTIALPDGPRELRRLGRRHALDGGRPRRSCSRREHHGRNPLYRVDLPSGAALPASPPSCSSTRSSPAGSCRRRRRGARLHAALDRRAGRGLPARARRTRSPSASRRSTRASRTRSTSARAEELWFAGDGDTKMHCFVVKPHGFDPAKKYPLDPQRARRPAVAVGRRVPRRLAGLSGQGLRRRVLQPRPARPATARPFTDAITGDWGGRVYRDLMKVTDAAREAAVRRQRAHGRHGLVVRRLHDDVDAGPHRPLQVPGRR